MRVNFLKFQKRSLKSNFEKYLLCKDIDKINKCTCICWDTYMHIIEKLFSMTLRVIHSFKAEQLLYEGDIFYE